MSSPTRSLRSGMGIRVPRIVLFVFGGVSELESEPETPAAEFRSRSSARR